MELPLTSYDAIKYPSYTHPQTHPDRMAVIGALSGLEPAPASRCRVLELGCGNASNLIPMAWSLPESQFVGVDLASLPIKQGLEMIQQLGLSNIRLVHGDVRSIGRDWGQFDYLIAHGLYSWIPHEAREYILEICQSALAPHGVAFISYNAYPGGHLRQMLGEMMRFHVRGFESAQERVKQAMALARFLAEAHTGSDEYQHWIKAEWETILNHQEGHLYHDELSEVNQPFYFTQFMHAAAAHRLQFVAEADYFESFDYGLNETTRQTLAQLGPNRILREQYLDFLKCRRFRQTLLCHADRILNSEPDASRIGGWLVSSTALCADAECDFRPGVTQIFKTPKNASCETDAPQGKASLSILGKIWPEPLPFADLFAQSTQLLRQRDWPWKRTSAPPSVSADFFFNFIARVWWNSARLRRPQFGRPARNLSPALWRAGKFSMTALSRLPCMFPSKSRTKSAAISCSGWMAPMIGRRYWKNSARCSNPKTH